MDALALLCTLHADGPQTLDVLRRAGCDSLASLESLTGPQLERCLGAGSSRAKRFLAESRILRERLGGELLEVDPAPVEPTTNARASAPTRAGESGAAEADELHARTAPDEGPIERDRDPETGDANRADGEVDEEPGIDRSAVDRVLEVWRERDGSAPAAPAAPASVLTPRPRAELPTLPPPGTLLETAGLSGLLAEEARRLTTAGCATAEGLVAADGLELARASGVSYTRIARLQFLARRAGFDTPRGDDSPAQPAPFRADSPTRSGSNGAPAPSASAPDGAPADGAPASGAAPPVPGSATPNGEVAPGPGDAEGAGGPFV